MTYLNRPTLVSQKKIEVCSELISDARDGKRNNEIIVFIGNYAHISQTLTNSLNILNININSVTLPIDCYDEHQINIFDKNLILVANTKSHITKLINLNKKILVIDINDEFSKNIEDTIIYKIIKNSDKYKKFNIRNSNTSLAYLGSEYIEGVQYV